jgi:hypothetical protein
MEDFMLLIFDDDAEDKIRKFKSIPLNLEILAEEAAEVGRIKSKIMRFGLDDYHSKNEFPNREALEQEIGHFIAMVEILIRQGVINEIKIEHHANLKIKNLEEWYRYSSMLKGS